MTVRFKSPLVAFTVAVAVIASFSVLPMGVAAQQGKSSSRQKKRMTGEQMEWLIFDLVNAERKKAGLSILRWDPDLLLITRQHSEKMTRLNAVTHYQDDKGLGARLSEAGFRGWTVVGENLGQNRGHANPAKAIFDKWLASKQHKKNILDPRWDVTAVGVAIDRKGQIYFTQDFVSFRR